MYTTMNSDAFTRRRIALEETFFQHRDAELLARLRDELAHFEEEHQLSHVSGITAEKVLGDLIAAGVRAESLVAVRLVPMVAVGWSDGVVTVEERQAILSAAAQDGVLPGTAAHELLLRWLDREPDRRVITAWKEYVQEMVRLMPAEVTEQFRARVERLCQSVAHASGGLLGVGTVSGAERRCMEEFLQAYDTTSEGAPGT